MRFILLLILLLSQQLLLAKNPPHLDTAFRYLGVVEIKPNRAPEIDKFVKYVKVPLGSSYCAAYVSYCIGVTNVSSPKIRNAMAQSFITKSSISANKVLNKEITIPPGTIVVWKNGDSPFGHVGFVREPWIGRTGKTIEANTSPSEKGNQANGDGIYLKTRHIYPDAFFRITHFTLVKYE